MAGKAIRGITVEIGGDTTKLGKALAESEKQTRSLQTELRDVEKLLAFDPGNTELLTQKQAILTEAIAETSKTLETLEEAQAQVTEQFEKGEIGENQYRAFQREIMTTQKKLNDLESELSSMDSAFSQVGSESTESANSLKKLTDEINDQETELSQLKDEYTNVVLEQGKNSKEAKALASEMTSLNTELKDNKDRLSKAEKEADKLADALDDAGDSASNADGGFSVMKGALADLTANAISSAISAIGDFIGSLFELSEATEEYRSMQAKLGGAANTFGYEVDFANEKYKEFYKYLGDDQMSTNAITNLMGLGTSTENVSALAEGAIGVWASYGDSIPIEALTESINETVQVGKVTGAMADTINWSAESADTLRDALGGNSKAQKAFNKALKDGETVEDAFNAALAKTTDEQERADIVAKFLNSTYGESKDVYDEMTGSMLDANEAELKLKEAQAQLGGAIEPVNTAMTNLKAQALEAILPVVEKLVTAFMDLYKWLQENPTAMKIITAVVIALAAAFGVLAVALGIQGLITGVTKAIAFLNTTLLANPIVLIIAAIAALVAAFIYLWNNCEGFRQFFIDLWATIKGAAEPVIDALVNFFTVTIPTAWGNFLTWGSGFIDSIVNWFAQLPERISAWLSNVITNITTWGSNMWTTASTWVSNLVSTVVNWFAQLPGRIWTWLANIITRVAAWGTNLWTKATSIASTFVSNVIAFIQQLPGKIWTWLTNIITRVTAWGSSMWAKAKSIASTFVSNVVSFIQQLPAKIWSWLSNVISRVASWGSNMLTRAKTVASNFVTNVVTFIQQLPGKVWSFLSTVISRVTSWGSTMLAKAKNTASNFINNIVSYVQQLPGKFSSWLNSVINTVATWGGNLARRGLLAASNLVTNIVNKIKELPSKVLSIGSDIVRGLWNGISNMGSWIGEKIKGFGDGVLNSLKNFFGIASPSKLMRDEVGRYIAEGIGVGVEENSDKPLDALKTLSEDMAEQDFNFNDATIKRKLSATFNADLANKANNVDSLLTKLDNIYKRLDRLQIVLDTGTLVGETIDRIDAELADKQLLSARGV